MNKNFVIAVITISFLFIIAVAGMVNASVADTSLHIEPVSKEYWTCVDYSFDYHQKHPDYGLVSISSNQLFRGVSHVVNYKVIDSNGTLLIHDGRYDADYIYGNWWNDQCYYHFWRPDESFVRTYNFLRDNRDFVLSKCNISINVDSI